MHDLLPKILVLACLSVFTVGQTQAEIYKCVRDNRTVYSDEPCGEEAQVIDVEEASKPTGTRFATDSMDQMGQEMGRERRIQELDRAIEDQQRDIDRILDTYAEKRARLDQELSELIDSEDSSSWYNHPYKRDTYYKRKRELQDEIRDTYRRFRTEREKAYKKLSELKSERRAIR